MSNFEAWIFCCNMVNIVTQQNAGEVCISLILSKILDIYCKGCVRAVVETEQIIFEMLGELIIDDNATPVHHLYSKHNSFSQNIGIQI